MTSLHPIRSTRVLLKHWGRAVALSTAAIFAVAGAPQRAHADDLWRAAKAYTASIHAAYEAAMGALSDAIGNLEQAQQALDGAKGALAGAAGSAASAAARAAVTRAAAAVATAEAGVAAASAIAVKAAACVAAFEAGTLVGQSADYFISWCWDPECTHASLNSMYIPLTAEQLSQATSDVVGESTGGSTSEEELRGATIGTIPVGEYGWDYVQASTALFATAAKGLASFSDGRDEDTMRARADLQTALADYAYKAERFADAYALIRTYGRNPAPDLAAARDALTDLEQFSADFADFTVVQNAIDQARSAMNSTDQAIAALSDEHGRPRRVDDLMPGLTREQFDAFLADCAARGADALPVREVAIADHLMHELGIWSEGGGGMGPQIAAWDALGDRGHESELFGPSGVLSNSRLILTALDNHWRRVDLCNSPVAAAANARILPLSDFNRDGFLDFFDVESFLTCFDAADCPCARTADFNQDGFTDFFDLADFIDAFEHTR